jgi:Family of unknown function (DUF6064)
MSEWWTYRLTDFALFSSRVYHRLFELQNEALWPGQIAALALGLILIWWLARPSPAAGRIVPAALAVAWLWIAWSFFWRSYATINWAAAYLAPVIALQGVLLLWLGAVGRSFEVRAAPMVRAGALGLLGASVLLYPLLAPALGRSWRSAELFGIAPDPTALATLAALAVGSGPARWTLSVLPALWCAISGATLWAIGAEGFWIPPAGAALAITLSMAGRSRA